MKRKPMYELEDLGPSRLFTPKDESQLSVLAATLIVTVTFALFFHFTGTADQLIEKAATLYLWLK